MLEIEHLSFDVQDEGRQSEILSDISFHVADGEMLVITGPNGGGKSTLAKLLMGINESTAGKIILNGEDHRSFYQRTCTGRNRLCIPAAAAF